MKYNSKKGFTLIELIIAIAIISIAATFAFQMYTAGAKATTNATKLDKGTQKIVNYFETGDKTNIEDEAEITSSNVTITINVNGSDASFKTEAETVAITDGKVKTSLTHIK